MVGGGHAFDAVHLPAGGLEETVSLLVLRLIVALGLPFAVLVTIIRAQPYHDDNLDGFVGAETDCPMPCFLGIRPNVTRYDEAGERLRANPWVAGVTLDSDDPYKIRWRWNGTQPALFDTAVPGELIRDNDNLITSIRVGTRIPYASTWLELGMVGRGYMVPRYSRALYGLHYRTEADYTLYLMACPAYFRTFWGRRVVIEYGDAFITLGSASDGPVLRSRRCQ